MVVGEIHEVEYSPGDYLPLRLEMNGLDQPMVKSGWLQQEVEALGRAT
jgi:hypothetical protein